MRSRLSVKLLGQVGVRLQFDTTVVYIDPYLSDSVENLEGPEARRLVPIPIAPDDVSDADLVLITHEHLDHCDPDTLVPISKASPDCTFVGSPPVLDIMAEAGISRDRLRTLALDEVFEDGGVSVRAVPAAHPDIQIIDSRYSRFMGYVIEYDGFRLYHAGDTSVHEELIRSLREFPHFDLAFIPVNEKNYYRDERGIIGNMSVRDAFGLAEEIDVRSFVPVHWDMFRLNTVFPEEIELLYDKLAPRFALTFDPGEIEISDGR